MSEQNACGRCGRKMVDGYISWEDAGKKVHADHWAHGIHKTNHYFPLLSLGAILLTGARVAVSKFSNTQAYCVKCGE